MSCNMMGVACLETVTIALTAGAGQTLAGFIQLARSNGVSHFQVPISTVSKPTSEFQSGFSRYALLPIGPGLRVFGDPGYRGWVECGFGPPSSFPPAVVRQPYRI